MAIEQHTDCAKGCAFAEKDWPKCEQGCMKTRELTALLADIDEAAATPMPALCFISAQTIAEEAARRGLADVDGNRHERALATVTRAAAVLVPSESDESPGGWARRGARDGIIAAWRNLSFIAPDAEPADLELYMAAYSLTRSAVFRIVADTRLGVVS